MVLNGSDSINKVSAREHQDLLIGAASEYDFANRSSVQLYPRILRRPHSHVWHLPVATKLKLQFDGVGP
jgi:hypothetical protein